eukprot:357022-Chlamydomonas_euryale.AAC.5
MRLAAYGRRHHEKAYCRTAPPPSHQFSLQPKCGAAEHWLFFTEGSMNLSIVTWDDRFVSIQVRPWSQSERSHERTHCDQHATYTDEVASESRHKQCVEGANFA